MVRTLGLLRHMPSVGARVKSFHITNSLYEESHINTAGGYALSNDAIEVSTQFRANATLDRTDHVSSDPVLQILISVCNDPSWRLRECLARSFDGFFSHYCNNIVAEGTCENSSLLSVYAQLLFDRESEVRVAAYASLPTVAAVNPRAFAQHPRIIAASCHGIDSCETLKVRVAAARAIMSLMAVLNPHSFPPESHLHLNVVGSSHRPQASSSVPLVVCEFEGIHPNAQCYLFEAVESKLFALSPPVTSGVEDSNHVDVLLATLDGLKDTVPYLTPDCAARVSTLIESINHENWRVRRAVNCVLPAVAAKQGRTYFEGQLLEPFVRSFQDRISEVRSSAVHALALLRDLRSNCSKTREETAVPVFDPDWLMEKIGKRLAEMYLTMSYYVYRITIVHAFETLAQTNLSEKHMESIILFLSEAAHDNVANVRLAAVQALRTVTTCTEDRVVTNLVKPVVNELICKDSDIDVRAVLVQTSSGL